jgi:hypothetical protein
MGFSDERVSFTPVLIPLVSTLQLFKNCPILTIAQAGSFPLCAHCSFFGGGERVNDSFNSFYNNDNIKNLFKISIIPKIRPWWIVFHGIHHIISSTKHFILIVISFVYSFDDDRLTHPFGVVELYPASVLDSLGFDARGSNNATRQ